MMSVMELLDGLNPAQQQAVTLGWGPALVLAGPGSGKTRVLARRVAYLIANQGVRPYNLLAVTFTNKAAREMQARVVNLVGEQPANGLTLGTFHAVCARILRREAQHLPFTSNFVIFDSDDQHSLVKQALEDLNIDVKRYSPTSVHAAISFAKNELLLPDDYPVTTYRDELVARVYRRYQELLLNSNAVDFDDLLLYTAHLLGEQDAVRNAYARRYEHILVDEFQDTNMAQYTLLKHLASFHRNLFVVGDIDQAIYRWRGADYRNVLRFEDDYPDAQLVLLEQNYRSSQRILDVAMAVIANHPHRTPKQLFTERGYGDAVILFEAENDHEEADYVVRAITELARANKARLADCAVMYRTNAQSRVLEETFLQYRLSYKLVGAQRFYGRREVKDVIAYLRLVHNPRDELSLTRVINTPPRGIGNKTYLTLRTLAKSAAVSPGEFILTLAGNSSQAASEALTGRGLASLANFAALLSNWRSLKESLTPVQLMDRILEDVDYRAYIDDNTQEGQDRWDNLLELRRLAAEFQQQGLDSFLEQVALVSDQDTLQAGAEAATLLTLHAAKGLEFPVVFIVGLNDGVLPHSRSMEDPEQMEEERRLLYVGVTRAMDRLHLIYARNRSMFGYAEPAAPSRFLDEIPPTLVELKGALYATRRLPTAPADFLDGWDALAAPPSRQLTIQYPPGTHVSHQSWGSGIVLNSKLEDGDEIVDIFFDSVGLKRVAASLAKLTIQAG